MGLSFKYRRLTDLKPYLAANLLVKTLEIKIKSNMLKKELCQLSVRMFDI